MIDFIKMHKQLSIVLLLSIFFFLRKGVQYATIGSYAPLLIVIGLMLLLSASAVIGSAAFRFTVRMWAILLLIWSMARISISAIHLSVRPFDDSWHMTHQFSFYELIFSFLILILGVIVFRNSNRTRLISKP